MNKIISITQARKEIFNIAEDVNTHSVYFTITEKGKGKAVIMSYDEFESWKETIEVLNEHPGILDDVNKARKELSNKETVDLSDLLEE